MKIKLNVIRGDLEEIHLENRKKKRKEENQLFIIKV